MNYAFALAVVLLTLWNGVLHYVLEFSFWALQGTIVAAFLRRSTAWRCIVLSYSLFLLLKASTPPINDLTGRNLRILPLGGRCFQINFGRGG